MSRVFLSHSHKDKPFARRLADDLRRHGHVVWIDEGEIQVGDSLTEKIRDGIDRVDFVIAVISEHSVSSSWVRKELDLASNREMEAGRVIVLPALLGDVKLPGLLLGKRYADFRDETRYDEALDALLKPLGPSQPLPSMPMEDLASLRKEADALRSLVQAHVRDSARVRALLKQTRSEQLQRDIDFENERRPEFAAINDAYAFEVMGIPVTLGYLLHAVRKADMKGMHSLDVALRLDDKWDRVDLMVDAYRDYLKLLAPDAPSRGARAESRPARSPRSARTRGKQRGK
ncbi:MAG: hypothetical protein CHACPFDD_01947 [Phycisphaerae bacterium]|nr:hypothetical protein [Phycisphaerae bacterium]